MKRQGVKVVSREPHFSEKVPNQIAAQVNGQVVKLPIMVGGAPEVKTYFDLIEYNLCTLLKAAQAAGVAGEVGDGRLPVQHYVACVCVRPDAPLPWTIGYSQIKRPLHSACTSCVC